MQYYNRPYNYRFKNIVCTKIKLPGHHLSRDTFFQQNINFLSIMVANFITNSIFINNNNIDYFIKLLVRIEKKRDQSHPANRASFYSELQIG